MDWREHIAPEPGVLAGKPVVKDTRLSVEFLLSLLANGWSNQDILDNYPNLTENSLRAVFDFALESARDERIVEPRPA